MRFLVHGTGAVGGYFGALLAHGGADVTFVARGATLAALRERGIVVHRPDGALRVPAVRAVDRPADAPVPDVVLLCVKSYDTPAAAAALASIVGPETIVLSLQNGVENETVLAGALGLPPLLVALTFIGVELTAPGEITYSARGEIVFGEPDGTRSARARRLADALAAAGVPHQLRTDVLAMAWEKLAWNAAFNPVTALTGTTVREALADSGTAGLIRRLMVETDAVATGLGVPVRRGRLDAVLADSLSGLPDFPTSMLQDLRRHRRLEWDAITGAVVRAADRAGVPAPLNRTMLSLLARLDPGSHGG